MTLLFLYKGIVYGAVLAILIISIFTKYEPVY